MGKLANSIQLLFYLLVLFKFRLCVKCKLPQMNAYTNLQEFQEATEKIQNKISGPDINPRKPTDLNEVAFYLKVTEITDIDVEAGTFKAQIDLIQYWSDSRLNMKQEGETLKITHMKVNLKDLKKIWRPKTVFENANEFQQFSNLYGKELVVVSSNGELYNKVSGSVVFRCAMNILRYPFDVHKCYISMRSSQYNLTACDLPTSSELVEKQMESGRFIIEPSKIEPVCETFNVVEEEYLKSSSCHRVEFKFISVRSRYYFLSAIPSVGFVATSFFSFVIPVTQHTARVSTMFIPLVGITYLFDQESGLATASNVWLFGCMLFVVFTIIEYLIALYSIQFITKAVGDVEREYMLFISKFNKKKETETPKKEEENLKKSDTQIKIVTAKDTKDDHHKAVQSIRATIEKPNKLQRMKTEQMSDTKSESSFLDQTVPKSLITSLYRKDTKDNKSQSKTSILFVAKHVKDGTETTSKQPVKLTLNENKADLQALDVMSKPSQTSDSGSSQSGIDEGSAQSKISDNADVKSTNSVQINAVKIVTPKNVKVEPKVKQVSLKQMPKVKLEQAKNVSSVPMKVAKPVERESPKSPDSSKMSPERLTSSTRSPSSSLSVHNVALNQTRTPRTKKLSRFIPHSRLKLIWNISYVPADIAARVAFPIAFVIYTYFYWLIYIM